MKNAVNDDYKLFDLQPLFVENNLLLAKSWSMYYVRMNKLKSMNILIGSRLAEHRYYVKLENISTPISEIISINFLMILYRIETIDTVFLV